MSNKTKPKKGYGYPEAEPCRHNIEILLDLEYRAIAKCKLCNELWRILPNGDFERIRLGSCPK